MDAMGFPVEALFFSDYYLSTVSSFWAWIAVLTAALSFWRIRAVGYSPLQKSDDPPSLQDQMPSVAASTETHGIHRLPLDLTPDVISDGDDGVTKGSKFAVYYYDDSVEDEADDERDAVDEGVNGDVDGVWGFGMTLPVVKTGDLGWYWCQDLTALNGNVVKLWDRAGCR